MADEPILDAKSDAATKRWAPIAVEARRRRLGIEIRDGSTELPYLVVGRERTSVEDPAGQYATLDEAFAAAETWVMQRPIPGADALRSELRDLGRRLAVATPKDFARRGPGLDNPFYRRFRDRILPLAFDNVVDEVRLETLEAAARLVVEAYDRRGHSKARTADLAEAVGTLRGLVEPKEAEGAESRSESEEELRSSTAAPAEEAGGDEPAS